VLLRCDVPEDAAAQRDQVVHGIQPVAGAGGQEPRSLGGRPHRHLGPFPSGPPVLDTLAVQTTARGRRARGSSARLAAFSLTRPPRIAAFSAARNVARIRFNVAAETGVPSA
jgi:hypothetical protein